MYVMVNTPRPTGMIIVYYFYSCERCGIKATDERTPPVKAAFGFW